MKSANVVNDANPLGSERPFRFSVGLSSAESLITNSCIHSTTSMIYGALHVESIYILNLAS